MNIMKYQHELGHQYDFNSLLFIQAHFLGDLKYKK